MPLYSRAKRSGGVGESVFRDLTFLDFQDFTSGHVCFARMKSGASSASAHPSREEFSHGEKQAYEREYDKYDLVDMVLAGRQSAQKVRDPEGGIVPEGKPGPSFTASVGDHGYHDTEETHPNRGHADRLYGRSVTRSGPHSGDQSEDEDGDSGDGERDPCDLEEDAFSLSHCGEPDFPIWIS